jgi:hypothetical protein
MRCGQDGVCELRSCGVAALMARARQRRGPSGGDPSREHGADAGLGIVRKSGRKAGGRAQCWWQQTSRLGRGLLVGGGGGHLLHVSKGHANAAVLHMLLPLWGRAVHDLVGEILLLVVIGRRPCRGQMCKMQLCISAVVSECLRLVFGCN